MRETSGAFFAGVWQYREQVIPRSRFSLAADIMTSDPFDKIYAHVRKRNFDAALCLLCRNGRIAKDFQDDLNHSWYCVGDIHFKSENFQSALACFKKSLMHWREDWQALMAIGNCYDSLGRPRMAERYFRKALAESDPDWKSRADAAFNLANALFDQGDFDGAIRLYRTLGDRDDEVGVSARKNLAMAQARLPGA